MSVLYSLCVCVCAGLWHMSCVCTTIYGIAESPCGLYRHSTQEGCGNEIMNNGVPARMPQAS